MAISYPIKLPNLKTNAQTLILQSPDTTRWEKKVDAAGVLSTTVVGSGTIGTLKLTALDGGIWSITVDNSGVLSSAASSGSSVAEFIFQADGHFWSLHITNDGVLQTSSLGGEGFISSIRFRPRAVVGLSASPFTLQQQAQEHAGQIWAADIQINELLDEDAEAWIAALLSLNGRKGTFLLGDPVRAFPRGSPTGNPAVNGAGQSGQVLNTSGWGVNSSKVLKRGDWIQLGTGTTQRIYRTLKDVDSDGSGNASIDIWPRLRESPANGEGLIFIRTAGVFRLEENVMPWEISPPDIYGFDFGVMEAI